MPCNSLEGNALEHDLQKLRPRHEWWLRHWTECPIQIVRRSAAGHILWTVPLGRALSGNTRTLVVQSSS